MPKDAWDTARRRNATQRTLQGKRRRRKAHRDGKEPARIASRCSQNTKLWFGKYQNTPVKSIPHDYLIWLIEKHTTGKSWRIDGLVLFLKSYLNKELKLETA